MALTAGEIRQMFQDYFVKQAAHTQVPSSSVVPHEDPTLLFTNAGMNQFKDVFLGQGSRDFTRAVDTQKCIRAGGKHNDLEDVGRDTYHHTFFEMLGNWSFGDYFKTDAIQWAWTLLTEVYGIDGDRLYATYFEGHPESGLEPDLEAKALWEKFLPASHVLPGNMKDNFWEMGDTGPCGPCSELHYDRIGNRNAAHLVNQDDPDVLEIWNLVFIQYNREPGGVLTPLPAQHVDTGMGLERLVSVLQDVRSNYDTDLFTGIFTKISEITGARPYGSVLDDPTDTAYRIIADHIRCLTSALADGATPGADGRGYVLRRILRRAVRHGRQTFGMEEPFLAALVPSVVEILGDTFPEMNTGCSRIQEIISSEEEIFRRTLDRGLALFAATAEEARSDGSTVIPATEAFKLHDTFGFPIDLTQVMAEESGFSVDIEGYEKLMESARARSRSGEGEIDSVITMPPDVLAELETLRIHATKDVYKHVGKPIVAEVRSIWNGRVLSSSAEVGQRVAVVLDRTPFYGEQGGQQGDTGELHVNTGGSSGHDHSGTFSVEDTQRVGDYVLHIGHVKHGRLKVGDETEARIDGHRRDSIRSNHTVTHLLNHALRAVASEESDQRGSLVAPDKLRFDYAARKPLTPQQIADIEARVRNAIEADMQVHIAEVPLNDATAINTVRAVFGERYPDPVRVVSIGPDIDALVSHPSDSQWLDHSVEFCGGTHLATTATASEFVLVSEQGLAAGIRRITALTGAPARKAREAAEEINASFIQAEKSDDANAANVLDDITANLEQATLSASDRHQFSERLDVIRTKVKNVRKAQQAENRGAIVEDARALAERMTGDILVAQLDGADKDGLLTAMDSIRSKHEESAVLLLSADEEHSKVTIVAKVPDGLIARGLKAGDWVKCAAQACGGGGGGRPDSAQAGGKDPSRVGDAEDAAKAYATSCLNT